ncbi:MAG TPA: hypothetical protein VLG92_01435 [Candidatus Saccharimonadia bacterium]|nr:hypothetical protein [Candidatus Saccharimonadia bacterium]
MRGRHEPAVDSLADYHLFSVTASRAIIYHLLIKEIALAGDKKSYDGSGDKT